MILAKRLKGKAIAAWLGPTGDAARRAVADLRGKVTSAAPKLELYYDLADPWSYLVAQATERLLAAYPVDFAFHPITPPASDVDPAPLLRPKQGVRDAQLLAGYWNLDFPGKKEADPGMIRDVGTALVRERPAADQLCAALELGDALWSYDKKRLALVLGKWGTEAHVGVPPILNANYAELRRAGHYMGGMLAYRGEWYWGIDRLPYLEQVLARDTGRAVANVVTARPEAERGPLPLGDGKAPLRADVWFSFRSPYSYLALEQIEDIVAPYGIPLALRPVLPLVARGAQMPTVKRMYIVRDAKREADRLGIPFGELCDPLGDGIAHCIAIAKWAESRGRALAFARSAMRGIWAEARDVSEYVDLRYVVERAELPWNEAREVLGDATAAKWAQGHAADLAVIGLWGVPSFRVGDFVAWGQDRLPLLADRLRRHAAVHP